jgi:hypothetical protein
MIFPTQANAVRLTSAANAAGDVFLAGLRIENAANPRIRATTTGGAFSLGGLTFTSTGRLIYVDATAGLPVDTDWSSGLPVSGGALCVSTNPATFGKDGIPFAANGAIAATITA